MSAERPDGFDPDYLVTLDEIYHSDWVAAKRLHVEQLRRAVRRFWPGGHPSRLIHVTGTSGKGSVAHYLEQGLAGDGPTGSWTGPHVFDYRERFHLDAEPVSRAAIVAVYQERLLPYQQALGRRRRGEALTFAELGILLALHLFADRGVRWGVMEAGAGGRYTPLMALEAAACVVTNVGGDHPVTLGRELWQRALDKAGIARPGVPFFTAAEGEARGYVVATAAAAGAELHAVEEEDLRRVRERLGRPAPAYEVTNLALALKVVRRLCPERDPDAALRAMSRRLPARFWSPEPGVIVDVAHNEEKVQSFAEELAARHPGTRFHFLVGLTRERDPRAVFRPLFPLAEQITVTGASYPGQDPQLIAERLRPDFAAVTAVAEPRAAFLAAHAALRPGLMLALTGSAYMIDQALNPDPYLRHLNASFGWRYR